MNTEPFVDECVDLCGAGVEGGLVSLEDSCQGFLAREPREVGEAPVLGLLLEHGADGALRKAGRWIPQIRQHHVVPDLNVKLDPFLCL